MTATTTTLDDDGHVTVHEHGDPVSRFIPCDLCLDVSIHTPAVSDARLPGGMWANLCTAHDRRVNGAGR